LHFSSETPIQEFLNQRYAIKITKTQDFSLMFGLISKEGKNKSKLYNRNCLIGYDFSDSGRIWM
jgi:hypothetical protein